MARASHLYEQHRPPCRFKSLTDVGFAGQVFRCLAGLWHIDSGQITKPGGDAVSGSLAGAVYYLPQSRLFEDRSSSARSWLRAGANPEGVVAAEPYQVLGTLFDQIAYPAESSEGLTRQRAIEILDEVELSYLADRPDIFEKETNWEEEISLGEKQRLAIARLIYHEPRIAVLDECTSAVSTSMEERLYCKMLDPFSIGSACRLGTD